MSDIPKTIEVIKPCPDCWPAELWTGELHRFYCKRQREEDESRGYFTTEEAELADSHEHHEGAEVITLTEETQRTRSSHSGYIWLDETRLATEWVAVDREDA